MIRLVLIAAVAGWSAGGIPARAGDPLVVTVTPSGFEAAPETAEEKLARRLARSDALFRSICRGCGRTGGLIETTGSFEPQASLDASLGRR